MGSSIIGKPKRVSGFIRHLLPFSQQGHQFLSLVREPAGYTAPMLGQLLGIGPVEKEVGGSLTPEVDLPAFFPFLAPLMEFSQRAIGPVLVNQLQPAKHVQQILLRRSAGTELQHARLDQVSGGVVVTSTKPISTVGFLVVGKGHVPRPRLRRKSSA